LREKPERVNELWRGGRVPWEEVSEVVEEEVAELVLALLAAVVPVIVGSKSLIPCMKGGVEVLGVHTH
jgi:hypothetical protein